MDAGGGYLSILCDSATNINAPSTLFMKIGYYLQNTSSDYLFNPL